MYNRPKTGYYGAYSQQYTQLPLQPQKYPQDIECVFPSNDLHKGAIYVSNVEAAENHKTLSRYQIKAVMTCAKGYHHNIPKNKIDHFQYFPCEDKDGCPISVYFEEAVDFIVKTLKQTNILVHCIAGVSRSVTMVLAYLIRQKGMSFEEAYSTVKRRRKIISPNDGFIRQLKQYAQKKQIKNPSKHSTADKSQRHERQNSLHLNKAAPKRYTYNNYINNEQDQQRTKISSFAYIPDSKYADYINSNKSCSFINTQPRKRIDADLAYTPEKKITDFKTQSKTIEHRKTHKSPTLHTKQSRSAYFQEMNRELNSKISAIHEKYEKQREKLMSRRYNGGTSQQKSKQIAYEKYPIQKKYAGYRNNSYSKGQGSAYSRYLTGDRESYLANKQYIYSSPTDKFKYSNYMDDKYSYTLTRMNPANRRTYIY